MEFSFKAGSLHSSTAHEELMVCRKEKAVITVPCHCTFQNAPHFS